MTGPQIKIYLGQGNFGDFIKGTRQLCTRERKITGRTLEQAGKGINRALTLGALCFKFLCVVGLKHRFLNFSQGPANFMSHDG